jgi:hypothetical protein
MNEWVDDAQAGERMNQFNPEIGLAFHFLWLVCDTVTDESEKPNLFQD